jgi:hypothetical protein
MMWWLENPARAKAERRGVAELEERASWLSGVRWNVIAGGALSVEFQIEHQGQSYPLLMTYSLFHPSSPPTIVPQDGRQLSAHQYLGGGGLCLEFRADNWETSIVGAMMIESAYRLISGERRDDLPGVATAHKISIGQRARGETFRILVTATAEAHLRDLEPGQSSDVGFVDRFPSGMVLTTIAEVAGESGLGVWASGREYPKRGFAVRLSPGLPMPQLTREGVVAFLDGLGLSEIKQAIDAKGADAEGRGCGSHPSDRF